MEIKTDAHVVCGVVLGQAFPPLVSAAPFAQAPPHCVLVGGPAGVGPAHPHLDPAAVAAAAAAAVVAVVRDHHWLWGQEGHGADHYQGLP